MRFPCVRAAATTPVQQMGVLVALTHPSMSAFPGRVAGSACTSSFSRFAQRSLTLLPAHSRCHRKRDQLSEGFRHFVASMPAPVASGWSGRRVGFAPTGKAPPSHGAHPRRKFRAGETVVANERSPVAGRKSGIVTTAAVLASARVTPEAICRLFRRSGCISHLDDLSRTFLSSGTKCNIPCRSVIGLVV